MLSTWGPQFRRCWIIFLYPCNSFSPQNGALAPCISCGLQDDFERLRTSYYDSTINQLPADSFFDEVIVQLGLIVLIRIAIVVPVNKILIKTLNNVVNLVPLTRLQQVVVLTVDVGILAPVVQVGLFF
ncbi:hypothetical protein EFK68_03370 [Pseudomonas aeruginosa]|nr:hypothetical protein EFK68_03370 [Pseudomonas aeruginosa]